MKILGIVLFLLMGTGFVATSCGDADLYKEVSAKNGANGKDGATGPVGPQGPSGPAGPQGPAGENGVSIGLSVAPAPAEMCPEGGKAYSMWYDLDTDGMYDDGETGFNTQYICNGEDGAAGKDGKDGSDGKDGKDGKDGESCTVNDHAEGVAIMCGDKVQVIKDGDGCKIEKIDAESTKITCGTGKDATTQIVKNGTNGQNGKDGKDGANGKDGKDGSNGKDGKDGESCKVQKDKDCDDVIVTCGKSSVTIPVIRNITICLYGTYDSPYARTWHTYTMRVDHFVADILGRRNYTYGKCK